MIDNQVTITGPGTGEPGYNKRTASLDNNIPFELPGGDWGIKLVFGAIIFTTNKSQHLARAVTYAQLTDRDDLRRCRILPGKVDITYKPVVRKVTDEEIFEELEAMRRDHA